MVIEAEMFLVGCSVLNVPIPIISSNAGRLPSPQVCERGSAVGRTLARDVPHACPAPGNHPGEAHVWGHPVRGGRHLGQLTGPDGAPEPSPGGGVHPGGTEGAGGVGGGGVLQPHRLQGLGPEGTEADQRLEGPCQSGKKVYARYRVCSERMRGV